MGRHCRQYCPGMANFVARRAELSRPTGMRSIPHRGRSRALASHAGAARVAHASAVISVLATWRAQGRGSYGVPEDERTPSRGWSLPALAGSGQVKNASPRVGAELQGGLLLGLAGAAAAFDNYAASKNGGAGTAVGSRAVEQAPSRGGPGSRRGIRVERARSRDAPRLGAYRTDESTRGSPSVWKMAGPGSFRRRCARKPAPW